MARFNPLDDVIEDADEDSNIVEAARAGYDDQGELTAVDAAPAPSVDLTAAREYVRQSISEGTRSVYARAFNGFCDWCEARGLASLPASSETVAAWLAAEADRGVSPATLAVRASAVAAAHGAAGHASPNASMLVSKTLSGIRRVKGGAAVPKDPLTARDIAKIVDEISPSAGLVGLRDRTLLLLGFATAMRRSEIAILDVEDIQIVDEGLLVTIPKSKTDQDSIGQMIAVPTGVHHCPVAALKEWLEAADIIRGPIFRPFKRNRQPMERAISGKTVARIIKLRAARAGYEVDDISGHSLRSGFLTSAAQNRANLWKMAEVSRHKSIDMLRAYVRSTELFEDHAGDGLL